MRFNGDVAYYEIKGLNIFDFLCQISWRLSILNYIFIFCTFLLLRMRIWYFFWVYDMFVLFMKIFDFTDTISCFFEVIQNCWFLFVLFLHFLCFLQLGNEQNWILIKRHFMWSWGLLKMIEFPIKTTNQAS